MKFNLEHLFKDLEEIINNENNLEPLDIIHELDLAIACYKQAAIDGESLFRTSI